MHVYIPYLYIYIYQGRTLCRWPLWAPCGCHLGGLVLQICAASCTILPPWEHLGASGEQHDVLEGVQHRIFIDFEIAWDPFLKAFWETELEISFLSGLFPGHCCNRFLSWYLDAWGSLIQVFARKVLQKSAPHRNLFYWSRVVFVSFFGSLGSSFSDFCCSEERLKSNDFLVVWRIQSRAGVGRK